MINESLADTVVICHHEKLFTCAICGVKIVNYVLKIN